MHPCMASVIGVLAILPSGSLPARQHTLATQEGTHHDEAFGVGMGEGGGGGDAPMHGFCHSRSRHPPQRQLAWPATDLPLRRYPP